MASDRGRKVIEPAKHNISSTVDLFEETEPQENAETGAFKIRNPEGNKWQRRYVHLSSEKSPFKQTVEMVLCAHGWEDRRHLDQMTLLAFRFHLTCHQPGVRYESCRIWFRFQDYEESTEKQSKQSTNALPTVEAWAPFAIKGAKYNRSLSKVARQNKVKGDIRVGKGASIGLQAGHQEGENFTRLYFDKGSAVPLYDNASDHVYGVEWYFEQNKLLEVGVEADFQVAILVKPNRDVNSGCVIPFLATFDMRVQAGFWEDFKSGVKRFFRPGKCLDEPIYFNPDLPVHVHGVTGEKLKALVDTENLGELAKECKLVKLSEVPGLEEMDILK